MRSFRPLLLIVVVSCSSGAGGKKTNTAPKQLTPKDIVTQSSSAIVRIEAGEGTGTGFIVSSGGLVATNLHVVVGKKDIKVKLQGGEVYPVMQIAGVDRARDLALLRIDPTKPLPAVRLGDSNKMSAGDQVVAIGNPLGVFDYSVSSGLVSAWRVLCSPEQVAFHKKNVGRYDELLAKFEYWGKCQAGTVRDMDACEKAKPTPKDERDAEELRCREELKILQISAPISQGSSGGPLFNQFGEVVGVTTAIVTAGQNINIAMPANYVKPMMVAPGSMSMDEFALKTRPFTETPDDGVKVVRKVPDHAVTLLKGCKSEQIGEMVLSIEQAIEVGAPLYNKGEIEACYRIYEGTAIKYERDTACPGISSAFGDGLLRAKTLATYKEKAWAMRDTFDGLLEVAKKWVRANGPIKPSKTP